MTNKNCAATSYKQLLRPEVHCEQVGSSAPLLKSSNVFLLLLRFLPSLLPCLFHLHFCILSRKLVRGCRFLCRTVHLVLKWQPKRPLQHLHRPQPAWPAVRPADEGPVAWAETPTFAGNRRQCNRPRQVYRNSKIFRKAKKSWVTGPSGMVWPEMTLLT